MSEIDAPLPPPDGWFAALAESEADMAAGRIVPMEVVLQELRQSIARMEAKSGLPREMTAGD